VHLDRLPAQVSSRLVREIWPELDARDLEAARQQRSRRLSRPAADLEQRVARLQFGERDEVVEQLFGIVRARGVVPFRRRVEGAAERFALVLGRSYRPPEM
jgi:hypothetical protein